MTPYYADPLVTLYLGDCLEVMPQLEAGSVDSVVTDPPYGIEFMGKDWDGFKAKGSSSLFHSPKDESRTFTNESGHMWDNTKALPRFTAGHPYQAWCIEWATEAFRVLKPGGYLLAFGGTRTYHRLASAIEDAGFEIRDTLMWVYASGFPKSLDVSKALDKVAGAEREVMGQAGHSPSSGAMFAPGEYAGLNTLDRTAPATDLARKWQGWGTALKPAHEPIVMARKPLVGSVAANVTRYGVGALNIDGTRIGTDTVKLNSYASHGREGATAYGGTHAGEAYESRESAGRWPSNVLLSDPELFDEPNPWVVGSGATDAGGGFGTRGSAETAGDEQGLFGIRATGETVGYGDTGGYSRFYLIPKSDRSERERGLDSLYCNCQTVKPDGWERQDQSRSGQTAFTSRARATSAATSQGGFDWPTTPSGSDTSDPSLPATRSTTSTATSKTTGSPTSSPSIASPTSGSTPGASSSTASGGSDAPSVPPTDRSPTNGGTSARKAGRSTADADPATSPASSPTSACESCGKPRHSTAAIGGADGVTRAARRNSHPTLAVKPIDLMRHLVRLVTPPGGVTLDPFLGSGTTALAASEEGFRCIGIEREADYLEIAKGRLIATPMGLGLDHGLAGKAPPKTHPDLAKHQPKRRAPADNYSGGWAGNEDPAA